MKLNDVFPAWKVGKGIFYYLTDMPWNTDVSVPSLDLDYHGNHSGQKEVSALIDNLLENKTLSEANMMYLARIIELRFKLPWEKLYSTLGLEYDVLKPYSMDIDEQKHYLDADGGGVTEANENKSKYTDTSENKNKVFGFNSDVSSPTEKSSGVDVGDSQSKGSRTTTVNTTKDHDETNHITRKGNYGFFTAQKLITDEREMLLWQFFNQVYSDIDTVLTCPLY